MGLHERTRRNGLHRIILLPGNRWKRIPKYRQILCGEMMKSYQLSVISCQRISNQRSGRIFFQKILSAVSKRGLRLTKASLLIADSRLLIALLLFLVSCGDEGLVDPHGETTLPPPETTGFHAIDLPTAPGSAWTYINVDTNQEFTLRVRRHPRYQWHNASTTDHQRAYHRGT